MSRRESRRSFFVALMSRAAGLYVIATGGAASLLAACVTKYGGPPEPVGPEPIAAKYGGPPDVPSPPTPTPTIAASDAPPAPTSAASTSASPSPSPIAVPKYGGPPSPVTKYGGPPRPVVKYGGPPGGL